MSSQHPLDSRRVIHWHRLEGSSRYILLMLQKSTSSGRLVVDPMISDGFYNVLHIPGGFLPGFLNHQALFPLFCHRFLYPKAPVSSIGLINTSQPEWWRRVATQERVHPPNANPPGNGRPYFRGYEAHHCHLIILFFMAN